MLIPSPWLILISSIVSTYALAGLEVNLLCRNPVSKLLEKFVRPRCESGDAWSSQVPGVG